MLGLASLWSVGLNCALLNAVEILIYFVLETERAAHFLRVEVWAREVVDDLPITVSSNHVLKRFSDDVSNVELFVLLIEKHSTWGHKSRSGYLKQERGSITTLI